MIICICHRISDRDIARAAREGCASFDELQDELRVATACGACHDCARETFDQHAGAAPQHRACGRAASHFEAAAQAGA
jgi:bacterioferritin-associated ferredoxin